MFTVPYLWTLLGRYDGNYLRHWESVEVPGQFWARILDGILSDLLLLQEPVAKN